MKQLAIVFAAISIVACGSDDDQGAGASAYPGENWPAIHRDARNSDFAPIDGAADLSFVFRTLDEDLRIAAVPSMGPTGNVYATTSRLEGCHLYAIDPFTGDTRWCTEEVDLFAVSSSALNDADGNVFIGDGQAMHSFTADGELRWESPIRGFAISSQFTPDGNLLFITHVGTIYVLDRATGTAVLDPVELIPGIEPMPSDIFDCFGGSSGGRCYSANTPAIDPESGAFYFTLATPDDPTADIVAMRYVGGDAPAIEPLWQTNVLAGGSAASPTISVDGTRIYGNDLDRNLFALDAATGELLWLFPLSGSPQGSVSLSPDGKIMPTGPGTILAVRDRGDHAELLWEVTEIDGENIVVGGVPVQTDNNLAYVVLLGGRLVVVDTETGKIVDIESLEGIDISIGTTVSSDGRVFVTGLDTGIWGFEPAG